MVSKVIFGPFQSLTQFPEFLQSTHKVHIIKLVCKTSKGNSYYNTVCLQISKWYTVCYLFLITMGEKKNAGFIHVITGININTILSEKNPYRKGHPDPIFTMSALFFFFFTISSLYFNSPGNDCSYSISVWIMYMKTVENESSMAQELRSWILESGRPRLRPTLPPTSCVFWGKHLNFLKPQVPHLPWEYLSWKVAVNIKWESMYKLCSID